MKTPSAKKPAKQSKFLFITLGVVALGGGFYYYQENFAPKNAEVVTLPSTPESPKKKKVLPPLKYVLREIQGSIQNDEMRTMMVEQVFERKGLTVSVEFLKNEEALDLKKDFNFYLDNTFMAMWMKQARADDLEPVVSSSQGCSMDTHILAKKDSPLFLDNIKEAKKVLIFKNGTHSPGTLNQVLSLGLDPSIVFEVSNPEDAVSALEQGMVDILIEDTLSREKVGKIGQASGKEFFEKFKQIHTTNAELPCRVVLMARSTSPEMKDKFIEVISGMKKMFKGGTTVLSDAQLTEMMKPYDFAKLQELQNQIKPFTP